MDRVVTVLDVADYFLYRTAHSDEDDQMTHLRLQKLVYYAQGYHLAYFGKPLFEEKIEAWTHGPVVPRLYSEYRDHGSCAIIPLLPFNPADIFTQDQLDMLDDVWEEYSQYSAIGLRNLTHNESPWIDTPRDCEITHDKMLSFFSCMIDNDKE